MPLEGHYGTAKTPLTGPGTSAIHKTDLHKKICDKEGLLKEITTIQDTAQESEHIKRIISLILEAKAEFFDIKTRHKDDTETAELDTFKNSLNNIIFDIKSWESRIDRKTKELQETPRAQHCTTAHKLLDQLQAL